MAGIIQALANDLWDMAQTSADKVKPSTSNQKSTITIVSNNNEEPTKLSLPKEPLHRVDLAC
jgi:hypothetical protein